MNPTVLIISTTRFFDKTNPTGHSVVGEACDGVEGLKLIEKYQPTIVFLHYEVEGENTDIYIKTLLIESPTTRIILVGKQLSDVLIINSLVGGCFGYIDQEDIKRFFDKAIQFVGLGEAWISRRLVGLLLERVRD